MLSAFPVQLIHLELIILVISGEEGPSATMHSTCFDETCTCPECRLALIILVISLILRACLLYELYELLRISFGPLRDFDGTIHDMTFERFTAAQV
jgi:hypothetical protein